MAKIGKLKAALDAHKGIDYDRQRQKRLRKKAAKRNRQVARQEEEFITIDAEDLEDDPGVVDDGGVKVRLRIYRLRSLLR
jgi:hypothetical protein